MMIVNSPQLHRTISDIMRLMTSSSNLEIMYASFIFLFISVLASIANAYIPLRHNTPKCAELFLNGFHFLAGNGSATTWVNHHYVLLSDEFLQCIIYTTKTTPANLAASNESSLARYSRPSTGKSASFGITMPMRCPLAR
jgi:hypothetical protein